MADQAPATAAGVPPEDRATAAEVLAEVEAGQWRDGQPDTAASIPYEGADCTPEEAVEAVQAVRAAAALDLYARVPDHVCDRHGVVWRVVRDGGMVTRAEYDGVESCGITYAESVYGPLRPVYVNGGPDGLAVEDQPHAKDSA